MNDLYFLPHETWAVAREARQCTVCQKMAFIFMNRFGRTTCVGCAVLLTDERRATHG